MNILTVNLLFSTIVFAIAAKLYLLPNLHKLEPRSVVLRVRRGIRTFFVELETGWRER